MIIQKQAEGGFTLPGYPHLGPGNSVASEPSGNPVDEITRQHDLAYEKAQSVRDIRVADEHAIHSFALHVPTKDALAAITGLTGLSLKTAVERVFGQVYPLSSNIVRHHQRYVQQRFRGGVVSSFQFHKRRRF